MSLPRRHRTRPAVVSRRRIAVVAKPKVANRRTSRVKPKNINVLATAAVTMKMMMMITKTIVIHSIRADRVAPNEVAIRVEEDPIHANHATMIEIESIRTNREIVPGLAIGTNLPKGEPGVDLGPRRGEDIRLLSRFGTKHDRFKSNAVLKDGSSEAFSVDTT